MGNVIGLAKTKKGFRHLKLGTKVFSTRSGALRNVNVRRKKGKVSKNSFSFKRLMS